MLTDTFKYKPSTKMVGGTLQCEPDGYHYLYHINYEPSIHNIHLGYVGISSNPAKRWFDHKQIVNKKIRNYHNNWVANGWEPGEGYWNFDHPLYDAMLESTMDCTNINFKCLFRSSCPVEIASLERLLRPHKNIGWNKAPGGVYKYGKAQEEVMKTLANRLQYFISPEQSKTVDNSKIGV